MWIRHASFNHGWPFHIFLCSGFGRLNLRALSFSDPGVDPQSWIREPGWRTVLWLGTHPFSLREDGLTQTLMWGRWEILNFQKLKLWIKDNFKFYNLVIWKICENSIHIYKSNILSGKKIPWSYYWKTNLKFKRKKNGF